MAVANLTKWLLRLIVIKRLSCWPTPPAAERQILGAIDYQANDVVLHSDVSMMPARRRAWASWNYRIPQEPQARALLTYDMNRLQGIHSKQPLLVTLNSEGRINPSKVHGRFELAHPVFNTRTRLRLRGFITLSTAGAVPTTWGRTGAMAFMKMACAVHSWLAMQLRKFGTDGEWVLRGLCEALPAAACAA